MRPPTLVLPLLLLLLAGGSPCAAEVELLTHERAVRDEYIVALRADAPAERVAALRKAFPRPGRRLADGTSSEAEEAEDEHVGAFHFVTMHLSEAQLARVRGEFGDIVAFVEADAEADGAQLGQLGCPSRQARGTWGLERLTDGQGFRHDARWGAGVDVYVADTGVLCSHRDLGGRCRWGSNYVPNSPNRDEHGHGTHIAGTIAGTTYGVAKGASIVAVKILDRNNRGYTSWFMRGLAWVESEVRRTRRPSVVNFSVGGGYSRSMNEAMASLVASGVQVGVAAMNDRRDACLASPASEGTSVTVGSTTDGDVMSGFSNWGSCVDIFAPGSNVLSLSHTSNTGTRWMSGTSMATPHVVGVMAAYLSARPSSTPAELKAQLLRTARRGVLSGLRGQSPNLLLHIPCGSATSPPATPQPPAATPQPPVTPRPPATPAPLPVPSWCSNAFTETFDRTGSFAYPVSGQYANNQERCFKIQCDGTVTLTWNRFDLERGYDYVYLLRVAEDGRWTQMWKRDGNQLPPRESHPGDVLVFIRTDEGVTARGFGLSWTCGTGPATPAPALPTPAPRTPVPRTPVPATPAPLPVPSWCRAFSESFDRMGSFAYPVSGQYANNEARCFRIRCDGTLRLTWNRFDLEKGYDYVFLIRLDPWQQVWARDGNTLPPQESHRGDVMLFMRTDEGVTARGFGLSWTCSA